MACSKKWSRGEFNKETKYKVSAGLEEINKGWGNTPGQEEEAASHLGLKGQEEGVVTHRKWWQL